MHLVGVTRMCVPFQDKHDLMEEMSLGDGRIAGSLRQSPRCAVYNPRRQQSTGAVLSMATNVVR